MNVPLVELLRRAKTVQDENRRAVGCLLVKARGSTPQSAGALMLVDDTANTFGTIGGGCVEAEVRQQAFAMLSRDETGILRYKLDHDFGWDDGLICGGTIEVAIAPFPDSEELERVIGEVKARKPTSLQFSIEVEGEPTGYVLNLPPRPRLYIAGAGHVGQALARCSLHLEFDVTIFDDRGDLLDRFAPQGAHRVVGDVAAQLSAAPIDADTYCVIVTRGHGHDEQALAAVVGRGPKYVGMIGSRRKIKLVFDDLRERGIAPDALDKVHAPIGLDIGAETVEEIALSIAAQLINVHRADSHSLVEGPITLAQTSADTNESPKSGAA